MTVSPGLGILAVPGAPSAFVTLVEALGEWCRPLVADQATESPAAWLASSPAYPGLATGSHGPRPLAVWVDDWAALEQALALVPAPRALVTGRSDVAALTGRLVSFPGGGPDLRRHVPLAPVVRRRWRCRLGLPGTMIVSAGRQVPGMLPEALLPTAMAVSSVVVAAGPRLAEAMAWGAPCVTDAGSAAALGAVDGDVVVGSPAELENLAAEVAAEDGLAAALSTAGRSFVERRFGRHGPARLVAEALGLARMGEHAAIRTAGRVLDDLGTPPASPLRAHVEATVASSMP